MKVTNEEFVDFTKNNYTKRVALYFKNGDKMLTKIVAFGGDENLTWLQTSLGKRKITYKDLCKMSENENDKNLQ